MPRAAAQTPGSSEIGITTQKLKRDLLSFVHWATEDITLQKLGNRLIDIWAQPFFGYWARLRHLRSQTGRARFQRFQCAVQSIHDEAQRIYAQETTANDKLQELASFLVRLVPECHRSGQKVTHLGSQATRTLHDIANDIVRPRAL